MTTLAKLSLILEICTKYSSGDQGVCAAHDVIFLPLMNEDVISKEDEEALKHLGAFKSDYDSWAVHT